MALVVACLVAATGTLAALPAALAAWLFARRVEDGFGPLRAGVLLALAAGAGALAAGSASLAAVAGATTGATLGASLASWPRARIIGLVLVPFFVTVVETPAAIVAAAAAIAAVALGAPAVAVGVAAACAAVASGAFRVERRQWEPVT